MKRLWQTHPRVLLAFLAVSALALFFAGRILWGVIYWAEHRNEAVQPWMTIGYVGRSWGLDPREIDTRAGLPLPIGGNPLTLQEIATQRGVPVADLIRLVEQTLSAMEAEKALRHGGDAEPDKPAIDKKGNPSP